MFMSCSGRLDGGGFGVASGGCATLYIGTMTVLGTGLVSVRDWSRLVATADFASLGAALGVSGVYFGWVVFSPRVEFK